MTYPAPLYDVSITYRTPSGKLVSFGRMLSYRSQEGGFDGMRHELLSVLKYEKRRRVARVMHKSIVYKFRTMQIAKGWKDCTQEQWADYLANAPRHYQTEILPENIMLSRLTDTGEDIAMVHYLPCGGKAYMIERRPAHD
jgi:hypothetical protein